MLTESQLKILSQFFSNMSIVWFAAGFVGATNIILTLQYGLTGIFSLVISLRLIKEVSVN